jgi:hypothetical protein
MKTALAIFAAIFALTVGASVALDAITTPASYAPAAQCGCILDEDQ